MNIEQFVIEANEQGVSGKFRAQKLRPQTLWVYQKPKSSGWPSGYLNNADLKNKRRPSFLDTQWAGKYWSSVWLKVSMQASTTQWALAMELAMD